MKKPLMTMLAVLMLSIPANAQNRKRTIDPYDLPKQAVELIQRHWPSCETEQAFVSPKEYEAILTDGTLIVFDLKGVWKEMKCTDGLPVTLVPAFITRYVVDRYPRILIIDVEKMRGGYEVTLSNGLEIQFDMHGRVTHVDD